MKMTSVLSATSWSNGYRERFVLTTVGNFNHVLFSFASNCMPTGYAHCSNRFYCSLYATGFSNGGQFTYAVGAVYADKLAAVVAHSGTPAPGHATSVFSFSIGDEAHQYGLRALTSLVY
eukprot:SAG31_NODE_2790_length_5089_cov_1.785772_4_plen_118_part_01